MNYYRRYVGDYLRDTSRLSMLEHGAYNLLLDYYYAEERPIPLDFDEVWRMVRAIAPEERRAVSKVLSTFFVKCDDGWHQKRVDHEIEVSQTARENGEKGGRRRTGNGTGYETGLDTGTGTEELPGIGGGTGHPPTTNLQPPTNQPPTAKKTGRKRPSIPLPEGFAISERVRAWAKEKGYTRLDAHFEHFVGWARASGRVYADWDQAFMNAIRDDWAKVRANGALPLSDRKVAMP